MARAVIKKGTSFEEARRLLASIGIVLTSRPHRKGGYVCKASKQLREQLMHYETDNEEAL